MLFCDIRYDKVYIFTRAVIHITVNPTDIWRVRHHLSLTWVTTTIYPKKYAHGFCFAVLCCGNTLTDFPISIRLTSLALWQSDDCPSASKATLMNMDKYFMWIHYERLRNHNKATHNKTVCIFLGIYCTMRWVIYFGINNRTGTERWRHGVNVWRFPFHIHFRSDKVLCAHIGALS